VIEDGSQIAHVDQAAASLALDEMLSLIRRRASDTLPLCLPRGIGRSTDKSSRKSSVISGTVTSDGLQAGHGIPAPPQSQARSPFPASINTIGFDIVVPPEIELFDSGID